MKNFWDNRYLSKEYVYGIKPNEFFASEIKNLQPGKLLLPAEGEGRNAVFAAGLGWDVTAFDFSSFAIEKARKLAEKKGVKINYFLSDIDSMSFESDYFDCISLIFVHTPEDKRHTFHRNLIKFLKKGGRVILEGFSKEQIKKSSGGPKKIEMLFSQEQISEDFSELNSLRILEENIVLNEGVFHQGTASVIRLTGVK